MIGMGGKGWGWRVGAKRKTRIGRERRREKERMKGVENIEAGKGECLIQLRSESGIDEVEDEEEDEEMLKDCSLGEGIGE